MVGPGARHTSVKFDGDRLEIFWSRVGDAPEHILRSEVDLAGHWSKWKASAPEDVLVPERDWEGADLPVSASRVGGSYERLNELRDSGIYREDGRTYLLYSIAGSQGIALAEMEG